MAKGKFDARTVARRSRLVALVLLFVAGVLFAAYPFVTNFLYQQQADDDLSELAAAVAAGDHEEYAKQLERAAAYNEELVGQTVPDVFAIREGTTDETYEAYLNVLDNQIMGSVEIPVINVHLPIYHYSTEESLLKGCGHIFGSSLPVGGESTHAVITAHRGLPAAKMFTDLDQLEEGDKFYLKVLDQTLAYEVDNIEVVAPTETRSLAIQRGEDLVTLVTCTPYGVNTDRLLVRGHRVPYTEGEADASVTPHGLAWVRILEQVGCVLLGVAAAYGLRQLFKRRKGQDGGPKGPGSRAGLSPYEPVLGAGEPPEEDVAGVAPGVGAATDGASAGATDAGAVAADPVDPKKQGQDKAKGKAKSHGLFYE